MIEEEGNGMVKTQVGGDPDDPLTIHANFKGENFRGKRTAVIRKPAT